ncbi:hypothetical protein BBO99_00003845 [Phytophthora kernoviae]|uniref:Uncharacterized protein n=1 Tax=Phytophthora kernoviae TaxID=325452 RepID=A0A3R7GYC7_9STRA|nr:hypothetical protein BBI17_003882 [Phytophthora kernoviae]RLN81287.1 hypothetical protein BBO99_00003845 [Phytophthora kernoviae]
MESKLEALFFDALAKHAGTSADGYSVDDLLFVAENTLGQLLVLPHFAVTGESIFTTDRLLSRTREDKHDLSVRYEIEDLVRSALHGAEALASYYAKVLELHQQNESVDFELKAQLFRRNQYTLDNMKEDAAYFTDQICALESLTKSTIVEFLHFDMDQLQAELLPSPARCLDAMRDLLPRLAREKCDKFLHYVSTSSSRIEKPLTQNLDTFTTYLLNIREVFEEVLDKESDLAFLHDFFRVLDKLKFKAPIDTAKAFELCEPEFQALKTHVQEAYANRDNDLQSYTPILTENLSQVNWLQSPLGHMRSYVHRIDGTCGKLSVKQTSIYEDAAPTHLTPSIWIRSVSLPVVWILSLKTFA